MFLTPRVSQGFTIDFTGSTVTFVDEGSPLYDSLADIPCHAISSLTVFLDKPVLCSSIAADGSDFQLSSSASIISATGLNCNGGFGYTREVELTFNNPIPAGSYHVKEAGMVDLMEKLNQQASTYTGFLLIFRTERKNNMKEM